MTIAEDVPADAIEVPVVPIEPEPGEATAVEVYQRPTPLVPGQDIPIIPAHQEMLGLAAMAVTLAGAQAVPRALQNKPNDVFQVLLTARDLGVAVTTAMREFHVIDGKVTLSPKVKLAMVNERGRREGWAIWPHPGNDAASATWYGTRADRPGVEFSSTFTAEEAKTAKLDGKDNWKHYPKRMLSWRALGYLLDDVFPEVGTGLYSPDELGAMTDEDGNYIDVASTEVLPGMKSGINAGGGSGVGAADWATIEDIAAIRAAVKALPDEVTADLAVVDASEWPARLVVLGVEVLHTVDGQRMIPITVARAKALVDTLAGMTTATPQDSSSGAAEASDGGTPPEPASGAPSEAECPTVAVDETLIRAAAAVEVADMDPDDVEAALFDPADGLWPDDDPNVPTDIGAKRVALVKILTAHRVEHNRWAAEANAEIEEKAQTARKARRG